MALSATTYKLHLGISDTDRGVYETVHKTIARHPSETEERLAARVLAFGLWFSGDLEFGRGLSEVDEPIIWRRRLDGGVEHWIDVGRPDADRLVWCARRYPRVSLLAYGNVEPWAATVLQKVSGYANLEIAVLPREPMEALAVDLPRNLDWGLMVVDGTLYVSDADHQHELALEWLKGPC